MSAGKSYGLVVVAQGAKFINQAKEAGGCILLKTTPHRSQPATPIVNTLF